MGGRAISEIGEPRAVGLSELLRSGDVSVATLFPGHPAPPVRYLWTDEPPGVAELERTPGAAVPPVELWAIRDVELRSDWMPYRHGAVIVSERVMPDYARPFYGSGDIELFGHPRTSRVRRMRGPAWLVTHFNMRTYGHFLLEVLPKLLLIKQLHVAGWRYPLIFPESQPIYTAIVRQVLPEVRLVQYADARESVELGVALLPGIVSGGGGALHEVFATGAKALRDGFSLQGAGGAGPARLFLSRVGQRSFRTLTNEAELAEVAAGFGFVVIRPQDLPWADQVRLFAGATHVVGEITSGLHNTLFCRPSAQVVGLNWGPGGIQSALAAAAGHGVGYIPARDGVITTFRPGWTESQPFEVDPGRLESRLSQLLGSDPARPAA